MACPLCGTRKSRRRCPALGASICPVCCGTKRRVEVACPADCGYLAAAEAHPPAVERKRRGLDYALALTMSDELSAGAHACLWLFQRVVREYRPTAVPALRDADVAEACATLAATLETSARGIIYEHQAQSLTAQRLVAELQDALKIVARRLPPRGRESDAALALRRMEAAPRGAAAAFGGETAYLDFLERLPSDLFPAPDADDPGAGGAGGQAPAEAPRLILP